MNSTRTADSWLCELGRNVHSQHGEDGIIEACLELLPDPTGWCVEFGAWDGIYLSNTCNLIENRDYSAVLIEGGETKFEDLVSNFSQNDRVFPVCAFVGFEGERTLDRLLRPTPIPRDFDLLSIDIDGYDYHVWEAVEDYRPRLVIIEFNQTIPTEVEFINPRDESIRQGSSLLAMCRLGKVKGYELVATTESNAVFVDQLYFHLFGIEDNSPRALRPNESKVTHIFLGYDGTVFSSGYRRLYWFHEMPFNEKRIQQLPKYFREQKPGMGRLKKRLLRLFRDLRVRGWV